MSDEEVKDTTQRSGLLEREGDVAADYLEGLLDILDLDGDVLLPLFHGLDSICLSSVLARPLPAGCIQRRLGLFLRAAV
ncbi:MAG: hypothetical protein ACKOE2_12090, partial [Actinomycetales bacterium]